jgi:D-alanyl-D-alanine carboxypeptidase/D-alanyl-D-alanine-endopeptidase (penicillin-binding protein 4)
MFPVSIVAMLRRHGSRSVGALLLTVALTSGVAASTATATPAGDPALSQLVQTLDAIVANPLLDGSFAAVVVRDAETGETLYDRLGDHRFTPASNTKFLTSTAAMSILGPDYRFTTDVLTTGKKAGSTLLGNLYLRGNGDPTALASDYDTLAAALKAQGIKTVIGDLVGDDTFFDADRLGTVWSWDDEGTYYSQEASALTLSPDTDYDNGNVVVVAGPGAKAGDKPTYTITPPAAAKYVKVTNNGSTIEAGGDDTLGITRDHHSNTIIISGTVPADGGTTTEWISVQDPAGYATTVFREALAAQGITVIGRTRWGSATPSAARVLAAHQSMTLSALMVPFLKLSNNGHAEALTKAMGQKVSGEGSWSAGLAAIRAYTSAHGMNTATYRQSDGSGLSRFDLIPPVQLTNLLLSVRAEPWFETWYNALPIAGNPDRFTGGTLRSRMRNTPAANNVHGKTGSLTGVSALSGYVTSADGRKLVFSVIENNYLVSAASIRTSVEDAVAIALASWNSTSTPAPLARMAPQKVQEQDAANGSDLECSWLKPVLC